MRCLRPYRRYWNDVLTGEGRWCDCPCGKCIACLHNRQDEWSIRAMETSAAQPYLVYDTLTFSNRSVDWFDTDKVDPMYISSASRRIIDRYYKHGCVPYVTRDCVKSWLKRGRENYSFDHGGERLELKYIIFQEYGPKTSRPHFHLLMWGISPSDYYKYFGGPWVKMYGWNKVHGFSRAKSIDAMKKRSQDFSCIARYISKYCSKGELESPFVLDGLQPPPVRLISNGIGAEYLDQRRFRDFLTPKLEAFREMGTTVYKYHAYGDVLSQRSPYDFKKYFGDVDSMLSEVGVSQLQAENLFGKYVDNSGYSHKLPRYYKEKLLKLRTNNVLSTSVQLRLSHAASKRSYSQLQRIAAALQCSLPDCLSPSDPLEVLCVRGYRLLYEQLICKQKEEALAAAEGCKTRLKNHYKRALQRGAFYSQ